MQKFVVKKISRSTNILLTSECEQSLSSNCDGEKSQKYDADGHQFQVSSVRMCGYLKKKRNRVGGWSKLYFVLQNSLLMSYNSKEEYEKKLVSFKDVICLIPNNTVLLPSLEPRFTIATNLHTFYTFRCDDNRTASKWITAILECLSRDLNEKIIDGKKLQQQCRPKVFSHSQPNLSPKMKPIYNHSWEHLPKENWIVTHNGRILMELNYNKTMNRAKLPIAEKTARLLQKCSENDVISTTPKQQHKVRFNQQQHQQQPHDENQNLIRNDDRDSKLPLDRSEQPFRLHSIMKDTQTQSNNFNRLSKMFGHSGSESSRVFNAINGNSPILDSHYSEIGLEEQVQAMSFGDETGDYTSIYGENLKSIDSKKLNNTLNIELDNDGIPDIADENSKELPVYATVNIEKKHEARSQANNKNKNDDDYGIYEDIAFYNQAAKIEESAIYEMIDIPLKPTQKSRSLVWKNWSNRIHLLDFAKRFRGSSENLAQIPSTETLNKRQRMSLTLADFSKRFNYRSMRDKAKKICNRNNDSSLASSTVTETDSESSEDKKISTKL